MAISASHEILDFTIYFDSSFFVGKHFTGKTLPLLTSDIVRQKIFYNKIVFEIGATQNYLGNLKQAQPTMRRLLTFLQKEYHLE